MVMARIAFIQHNIFWSQIIKKEVWNFLWRTHVENYNSWFYVKLSVKQANIYLVLLLDWITLEEENILILKIPRKIFIPKLNTPTPALIQAEAIARLGLWKFRLIISFDGVWTCIQFVATKWPVITLSRPAEAVQNEPDSSEFGELIQHDDMQL